MWKIQGIELDGIICPPFPVVAGPHKHFENMTGIFYGYKFCRLKKFVSKSEL